MYTRIAALVVSALMITVVSTGRARAHEIFQDVLKEKYVLKSFACKTCHPNADDKKVRSMFAELIYQELKDKKLSEKFAVADAAGQEAVEAFEKSIVKDFEKAMEAVGKKQLTVDELFKSGLINGARLDEKKLAAMSGKPTDDAAPESTPDDDDQ